MQDNEKIIDLYEFCWDVFRSRTKPIHWDLSKCLECQNNVDQHDDHTDSNVCQENIKKIGDAKKCARNSRINDQQAAKHYNYKN